MDADRAEVRRRYGPPLLRFAAGAGFAAIPVLFLCLFLIYPLERILALGLGPVFSGGFSIIARIARETDLTRLLLASGAQALASTVLSVMLGLPIAYVFGRYSFPGKGILRTLLGIPFVLPTVVVASAFVELIGSGGLLEKAAALITGNAGVQLSLTRSIGAVLLAHVFYNLSVVVRIVGGAWSSLDPRLEEAARTLGVGRFAAFRRVTLPLLFPALFASSLLVFAFCFSSFGVILVLGGPRIGTLETEIYRQAVSMFDLPSAAVLSIVQLVVTAAVMYGYSRVQARMSVIQNLKPESLTARGPRNMGEKITVSLFGFLPIMGLVVPMLALASGSFISRGVVSASFWKALVSGTGHSLFWISPLLAAGNSFLFALETVAFSLVLGIPAAYLIAWGQGARGGFRGVGASVLDILFLLPLGTSAVTLGFGFILSMGAPALNLRGSAILIPIAHSLVALPLVIRSLLGPLRSINPRMRQAAAVLGAGPTRVRLEIDLPVLRRAFVAAAAFAFTVSLGEFGATALLTRPELVTLPVLIYDSLGRPGASNQGQALALSTILMLACAAGLAAIEKFRTRGTEAF